MGNGCIYLYDNADELLRMAKAMPKRTPDEKEIRSDAIKNARIKKRSARLLKKFGADSIKAPDESVQEEILSREATSFIESMKIKREFNKYLKMVSIYTAVVKPYTDAQNLLDQFENYTHYEELESRFLQLCEEKAEV